ncbi:MAG: GTPase ObgE [Flavobacteriales bacterium]|nr:GTPase ObgE [Flavobacteriales bacterium]
MSKNRKEHSSNFVDYVKIFCASGNGGAGSVHFRREKFVAMGGPDGGDGGRGGHVILRGERQLWTLLHLKYRKHIKAQHGKPGGKQTSTGKSGDDVYLDVPLGTVVKDADTNEVLFEITEVGQELIVAEGGVGGLGNWHFKNSTQQTPRYAQPGTPGIEGWFLLELKVLADVGLVGFPNAGKSTLLSVVSAAKPEIADYAFTTLTPNLGIVAYRENLSFVMADIPGIIKGASEGKGLGYRFLRHIERNSVLLFLIPADSTDHFAEYQVLENELENYNDELMHKDRIVAISKCDMLDQELMDEISKTFPKGLPHIFFSSITQKNLPQLKDHIWTAINRVQAGSFQDEN